MSKKSNSLHKDEDESVGDNLFRISKITTELMRTAQPRLKGQVNLNISAYSLGYRQRKLGRGNEPTSDRIRWRSGLPRSSTRKETLRNNFSRKLNRHSSLKRHLNLTFK